jgi:mannose/fructose/N-acetylgalactosamine-specific phosphotransferase system component IIC
MSPWGAGAVLAWAALCAADQRALGGRQLHQPLVAAIVAGALLGDAQRGMWVGLWLLLVWTVLLPIGGVILPDVGAASVVAAILAVGLPGPVGVAIALAGALGVARVSVPWERALRAVNARRERRALETGRLGAVIAHGIAGPAVRGALCAGSAVLAAHALRMPLLESGAWTAPIEWVPLLLSGAMAVGVARIGRHALAEAGRGGWAWLALGAGAGVAARWILPLGRSW